MLEFDSTGGKYFWCNLGGIKAIYRGYLIANLIAILHLNIFTSFSDIYQQIQFEHN